jgi:hypothetical protein
LRSQDVTCKSRFQLQKPIANRKIWRASPTDNVLNGVVKKGLVYTEIRCKRKFDPKGNTFFFGMRGRGSDRGRDGRRDGEVEGVTEGGIEGEVVGERKEVREREGVKEW